MPTLDYMYNVNDTVYNIDKDHGIRSAVVKKVDVTLQYNVTTIQYTVAFTEATSGSTKVDQDTLFPTADSAWEAYKHKYLGL